MNELKYDFNCSTMKRIALADVIAARMLSHPFCITIDHDTLEDNCVTIRYRDTMEQERVPIVSLRGIMEKK